jgi:hypothetical protein
MESAARGAIPQDAELLVCEPDHVDRFRLERLWAGLPVPAQEGFCADPAAWDEVVSRTLGGLHRDSAAEEFLDDVCS